MASQMIPIALILSLSISLLLPSSLAAGLICEELPLDLCAFSVSSAGHRCILESYRTKDGGEQRMKNECKTSDVVVERVSDWIESDECVRACGVDRTAKGISSDALLDSQFTGKLCSSACFESCPNIVDLYFNLAAAEGVFLPDLCHARRSNPHRSMVEMLSSGAASGPVAAVSAIADEFAAPPSA